MKLVHLTVAYNSPEDMEILFSNIGLQEEEKHHIICVDNSDDVFKKRNEAICRKFGSNQNFIVDYYRLKQNYGSSKGYAIAMTLGYNKGADFLWLHDQDGFPLPDCLTNIRKYFNSEIEILGPRVLDEDNDYLNVFNGIYNKNWDLVPVSFNGDVALTEVSGTAGLCISRKIFDKIGTYDYKHYFIGNEDFDYCLRARNSGSRIGVVKDALYFHPNKWVIGNPSKKRGIVRYFGDISSAGGSNRNFSNINYHIKYCNHNFLINLSYSVFKVLVLKITFHKIKLLTTYKCYLSALINRSGKDGKITIDPYQFIA